MFNKVFRTVSAAAILTAAAAGQSYAYTYEDLLYHHVVRDERGQVVRSIAFNNCVRTKWRTEDGTDPCGVAEISPARQLTIEQRTIYFDFDKAALRADARARLDNLANVLRASGDVRYADIVGYADRIGNAQYNVALSKRRAEAVKDYLAQRGYLDTRVAETRGLGESRPTAKCEGVTPHSALIKCLQPDRRVEIEVRFMDTPYQPASTRPVQR